MEYHLSAIASSSFDNIQAITWDIVELETERPDLAGSYLCDQIGLPRTKEHTPTTYPSILGSMTEFLHSMMSS